MDWGGVGGRAGRRTDAAARARMEALLEESLTQPTRSAIRAGNVYVIVAVYGYDGDISVLRVVVPE